MTADNGQGDGGDFERAVLICPDARLRQSVETALGAQLALVPLSYADPPVFLATGAELCLVDVGTDRVRALNLVRQAAEAGVAVIALHRSNDPDLILEALRAGAGEFLIDPVDAGELRHAVARLARRPGRAPRPPRGKIWMLLPSKGAAIGTLLSCQLAERVARRPGLRVLLADMDPVQGSVGFLLKLKAHFSVADALADPLQLDSGLWRKLTARHAGLDVLLAPERPQPDTFAAAGVAPVFEFLRRSYEVTLADSPGPFSPWQLQMARECDTLLLVTRNDLGAVQATQRLLRLLEAQGVPSERLRLILHGLRRESGLSRESIEAAWQRPVFHELPYEAEEVQADALAGRVSGRPDRVKSVDALCDRLLGPSPRSAKKPWGPAWPKFLVKNTPQL